MEVPLPWANIQEEMEEVERVICGSSDDFTNILSLPIYKIKRYYFIHTVHKYE